MTTEDVKLLFEKAYQYAETKFGRMPDSIVIEEDGTIHATWSRYMGCGEYDTDHEYFKPEDLI